MLWHVLATIPVVSLIVSTSINVLQIPHDRLRLLVPLHRLISLSFGRKRHAHATNRLCPPLVTCPSSPVTSRSFSRGYIRTPEVLPQLPSLSPSSLVLLSGLISPKFVVRSRCSPESELSRLPRAFSPPPNTSTALLSSSSSPHTPSPLNGSAALPCTRRRARRGRRPPSPVGLFAASPPSPALFHERNRGTGEEEDDRAWPLPHGSLL